MSVKLLQGFFPLLTDPFPVPELCVETVSKAGKVGAGISDRFQEGVDKTKTFPHHVVIARLSPESPFQGTSVKLGHQVIAVNDDFVVTALQGAKLIRESKDFVTLTTSAVVEAPYCRHFAVGLSDSHPGVTFDSACNNSLVYVSKVYKNGPFRGFMNQGDIILAINGKAVSSPTDATNALLAAYTEKKPFVTIYLVDIHALRRSLTHQCMSYFVAANPKEAEFWKKVSLQDNKNNQAELETNDQRTKGLVVNQGGSFSFRVAGKVVTQGLQFDQNDFHIQDTEPYLHLVAQSDWGTLGYENPALFYKGKYRTMVIPFIQRFNSLLEENLTPLRESIAVAIWRQHTGYIPPEPSVPEPNVPAPIQPESSYTTNAPAPVPAAPAPVAPTPVPVTVAQPPMPAAPAPVAPVPAAEPPMAAPAQPKDDDMSGLSGLPEKRIISESEMEDVDLASVAPPPTENGAQSATAEPPTSITTEPAVVASPSEEPKAEPEMADVSLNDPVQDAPTTSQETKTEASDDAMLTAKERMMKVKELLDLGLISQEEFEKKRQEVINSI